LSIAKLVNLRAILITTILMISLGAQATELGNGLLGVARYGGSTLPSEPELVSAIANSDGIEVTFNQSSEDGGFPISGYQYSVDGVTWYDIPSGLNTFTIPLSIATPGSTFSIQLRAVSQAGSSRSSPAYPVAVPPNTYSVTPSASDGGAIAPNTVQTITEGDAATFTLVADALFEIDTVSGTCGGNLEENTYTTNPITADCTVIANFSEVSNIRPARPIPTLNTWMLLTLLGLLLLLARRRINL